MKVTAIIPSLYEIDGEYLKLAVESLRATTDWDIIVVTNGGRYKPDLSAVKGITVHLHTRDQGQCNAVNIGAQLAAPNTDYLFISNSDMYYAPTWKDNLRFEYPVFSPNLVEPNNNAGSASPFLRVSGGLTIKEFNEIVDDEYFYTHEYYEGIVDHYDPTLKLPVGYTRQDYVNSVIKTNNIVLKGVPKKKKGPNYAYTEEPGFNFPLFIKKNLWDLLGGYDIAFDPWGSNSDTDLQTRINLAGVTPVRLRDVLVYHFSNKSGTFDGTHQDFYQNNIDYFRDKFGFDRDELGSDVWYNKDMIPTDPSKIKYQQRKYVW